MRCWRTPCFLNVGPMEGSIDCSDVQDCSSHLSGTGDYRLTCGRNQIDVMALTITDMP